MLKSHYPTYLVFISQTCINFLRGRSDSYTSHLPFFITYFTNPINSGTDIEIAGI